MLALVTLHSLSELLTSSIGVLFDTEPTYWYQGYCPKSGQLLRLPRTALAEMAAQGLMQYLDQNPEHQREGKMYGVLIVATPAGEQKALIAFSGLLNGKNMITGWVPPIAGRSQVALEEARTLTMLDEIKQELLLLQQLPVRQQWTALSQDFTVRLQQLQQLHQQRRQQRRQQRYELHELHDPALALEALNEQSRQDGIERRRLKQQRDAALHLLQQQIEQADSRIRLLKQRRRALSRQLQQQMQDAYSLTNFAGETASLETLKSGSLPTGAGECCAPKLLHYAATHALQPLALAEFWWGSSTVDRQSGCFYPACQERCQPLMGFLLSGLPAIETGAEQTRLASLTGVVPILYQDDWLIAVNKPAALLSVPGRYLDRQDSVLSRLRLLVQPELWAVHRLDQETSGILLLARDRHTYRQLAQQFEQRQVNKRYIAILTGSVQPELGVIDLPLWADPINRPYQTVDWQRGKPSLTQYRVLSQTESHKGMLTQVEFTPLTGRTHQLRVHAAVGLGTPILGDRLYGCETDTERLYLHATTLCFQHPQSGERLVLQSEPPFELPLHHKLQSS
jgi:tRNA pseudouridine32 synthase/23S rRNA pseudouridine746 synthase